MRSGKRSLFSMDRSFYQWPGHWLFPVENPDFWANSRQSRSFLALLFFAVLATLLVGTISWIHILSPLNIVSYDRDVWHHLAVLNELIVSPLHANNPHVLTDDPSRSYTPWTVLLAVIGILLGLDAQQTLGVSALLTMLCFVSGIWLFARLYWDSPWAPFVFLVVIFATWGRHFNHTGFYTLTTLTTSASYQFGIVWALGFWSWWLVLKAIRAERMTPTLAVSLTAIAWLMFITHQLQGAFAIGAMLTFAVFVEEVRVGRRLMVIGAILIGGILTKMWWYFDPIDYVLLGEVHKGRLASDWRDPILMVSLAGLTPLGIWGFYDQKKKHLRLDLLLGTLAIAIGFSVTWYMNKWVYLRIFPFLILFLQIGVTCLVVNWLPNLSNLNWKSLSTKQIITLSIIGMLMYGLCKNTYTAHLFSARIDSMLNRIDSGLDGIEADDPDSWSPHIIESMQKIRREVEPNSVLLTHSRTAFPAEASHMKVVAIPRLFALVPDMLERQHANKEFFKENTSVARRCEIIKKYGVAGILFRHRWLPVTVQEQLKDYGRLLVINDLGFIKLQPRNEKRSMCNDEL